MDNSVICQDCGGNGFIRLEDHPDVRKQSIKQCKTCDSQGELPRQMELPLQYHKKGTEIDV